MISTVQTCLACRALHAIGQILAMVPKLDLKELIMPDSNTNLSNADDTYSPGSKGSSTSGSEGMMNSATSVVGDIASTLKSRAGEVAGTVSTEAANYADRAKGTIADEVKSVASALRTAADEMSRGSASERTFSQIANSLADASDAMRDKDLGQIVSTVSDYAKRNPLIFLGGAALVGFAAVRFAKASSDKSSGSSYSTNYAARSTMTAGTDMSGQSSIGEGTSDMESSATSRPTEGNW